MPIINKEVCLNVNQNTRHIYLVALSICFIILSRQVESYEPKPPSSSSRERILACYYRPHIMNDTLLSADVCTHIIFAFANMSPEGIVTQHPTDVASYRAVIKLKEKNPKLRVIISISAGFQSVVSFGTEAMLRCSLGTVKFLNKYGFDGVDMDWEFPDTMEKQPFSEFIMILSTVLHNSNKTLSLAMPNSIGGYIHGYFTDTINKYTDFVTIMTYDFKTYSKDHNLTDYNSPLYTPHGDDPLASTAGIFELYLLLGLLPSKMILGFPTYARTWELANASVHGLHSPAVGFGAPGPVTNLTGYYLTQDICVAKKKGGLVVRDEQNGAEYMVFNKTWIAFNGMYSAEIKTDWLKKHNLAGVGVWTFDFDDPSNLCGLGPYPVLRAIRSRL